MIFNNYAPIQIALNVNFADRAMEYQYSMDRTTLLNARSTKEEIGQFVSHIKKATNALFLINYARNMTIGLVICGLGPLESFSAKK